MVSSVAACDTIRKYQNTDDQYTHTLEINAQHNNSGAFTPVCLIIFKEASEKPFPLPLVYLSDVPT
jgi:hypothetical protein